jgi:hypothetical protein
MLFEYNYPSLDQNILQMVFRISLVNALRSLVRPYVHFVSESIFGRESRADAGEPMPRLF